MLGVRRVSQSVGPDALAVRVDHVVRDGNGAPGQGPRAETPAANDGAQRTGDIPRLPGEGERVGTRTAPDQSDGRQPAEDGRTKVAQARADAHDADVQGMNYNRRHLATVRIIVRRVIL